MSVAFLFGKEKSRRRIGGDMEWGEILLQNNYNTLGRWRETQIIEVIRYYAGVEFQQRGRDFWCCCPLHQEKTPSFAINVEKNAFYCYGCHAGGSAADFLMKLQGLTFKEAATKIEMDFGLQGEHLPAPRKRPAKSAEQQTAEAIQQTFDLAFATAQAIRSELRRRKTFSPDLVEGLGEAETVVAEIGSGEPERVAVGLVLSRRWRHGG